MTLWSLLAQKIATGGSTSSFHKSLAHTAPAKTESFDQTSFTSGTGLTTCDWRAMAMDSQKLVKSSCTGCDGWNMLKHSESWDVWYLPYQQVQNLGNQHYNWLLNPNNGGYAATFLLAWLRRECIYVLMQHRKMQDLSLVLSDYRKQV